MVTKLFIYRNNCKSSKQVLDIFAVRQPEDINMLNLNDFSSEKEEYVLRKYKIRDIPCVISGDNIMYSSEMFSYIKNSGQQEEQPITKEGFFMGLDGGGSMFSQQFAATAEKECACNTGDICKCAEESGAAGPIQSMFQSISGIGTPSVQEDGVSKQQKKKGGKKGGNMSETDRRFEKMMEMRNQDATKGPVHNNRVDFSKPMTRI